MHRVLLAREAMATRFEILMEGSDPAALRSAAEEALDEVVRWEERLSLFRESSDVSRINRLAAREPVQVDAVVFGLLQRIAALSRRSRGAFDVTVGPLMRVWGFRGVVATPPSPAELEAAQLGVGMNFVELDPARRTVRFLRRGTQVDLGGVGKGFALAQAGEVLREGGVDSALLHAGTSTVLAIGAPAGFPGWEVALPWPEQGRAGLRAATVDRLPGAERLLSRVWLRDEALSVSAIWGGSSRTVEGPAHVIDPRTFRPVRQTAMAAVIHPSATDADAYSTALLVGGESLQCELADSVANWRSLVVVVDAAEVGWRVAACGWDGGVPRGGVAAG